MAAMPVSGESFVGKSKALGRWTLGFFVHITSWEPGIVMYHFARKNLKFGKIKLVT